MNAAEITFGAELRRCRVEAKRSLSFLASDVGYSKAYLSKVENGISKPSRELARKCDTVFETTVFTQLLNAELEVLAAEKAAAATAKELSSEAVSEPGPKHLFEDFYRKEHNSLVTFIRASGVGPDAPHIAQDVMVECFKSWSTIKNPSAWVRTVAKYKIADHWRRELRRRDELTVDEELTTKAAGLISPSAEEQALTGVKQVQKIFGQLPEQQKTIMLGWVAGATATEIARELDISPENVRAQVKRAKHKLRLALERESAEGGSRDLPSQGTTARQAAQRTPRQTRAEELVGVPNRLPQGAEVQKRAELPVDAGRTFVDFGNLLLSRGRHTSAITVFSRAALAFEQAGDSRAAGHAILHLAEAYRAAGRLKAAAQAYALASCAFDVVADNALGQSAREAHDRIQQSLIRETSERARPHLQCHRESVWQTYKNVALDATLQLIRALVARSATRARSTSHPTSAFGN